MFISKLHKIWVSCSKIFLILFYPRFLPLVVVLEVLCFWKPTYSFHTKSFNREACEVITSPSFGFWGPSFFFSVLAFEPLRIKLYFIRNKNIRLLLILKLHPPPPEKLLHFPSLGSCLLISFLSRLLCELLPWIAHYLIIEISSFPWYKPVWLIALGKQTLFYSNILTCDPFARSWKLLKWIRYFEKYILKN